MTLPAPTTDLLNVRVGQFDTSERVVENALRKLVTLLPSNTDLEDILLKVVTINSLYGTWIYKTYPVAEHILEAQIDGLLATGNSDAVDRIRVVQIGEKSRNNYSFATKYCAWHNPEAYPIYDSFVDEVLWAYRKQDGFAKFQRQSLWQYANFKRVILSFREHYGLQEASLRDIDKFLWLVGQEHFG